MRPLADLEPLIAESTDSKTIIGLARLQALLAEEERLPPAARPALNAALHRQGERRAGGE